MRRIFSIDGRHITSAERDSDYLAHTRTAKERGRNHPQVAGLSGMSRRRCVNPSDTWISFLMRGVQSTAV